MTITKMLLAAVDEAYDRRRGTAPICAARCAASHCAGGMAPCLRPPQHLGAGGPRGLLEYNIRRRLTGEKGRSFALEGSNFWARPIEGTVEEWKSDLALLETEHRSLRKAVAEFPQKRWMQKAPGKPFKFEGLVRGVAAHDLYHAGQIQLLKGLQD